MTVESTVVDSETDVVVVEIETELSELELSTVLNVESEEVVDDGDRGGVVVLPASTVTTVRNGTKAVNVVLNVTGSAVTSLPETDRGVESDMFVETSTMSVTGMAVKNVVTPGVAGSVKLTSPVGIGKKGSMPSDAVVVLFGVKELRVPLFEDVPHADECHPALNGVAAPVTSP